MPSIRITFAAADAVIMKWGSIITEDFKHQNDRCLMILNEGLDPCNQKQLRDEHDGTQYK